MAGTNILFLITDLNMGGTEKMLYETATRLNKDFNPFVYSIKKCGEYAGKLRARGIKVYCLEMYKYGIIAFPVMAVASVIMLANFIRREKIGIVHTFLFQANILGRLSALLAGGVPVISSIRVMEKQKRWQAPVERLTSGMCRKIIVNSMALKSFLVKGGMPADKLVVLYNGVEQTVQQPGAREAVRSQLGIADGDIMVCTAGRLHEQKGMEHFISAIPSVLSKFKNVLFVITGDGPQKRQLEAQALKMKILDKVIFTGFQPADESVRIISSSDIFVLPSLWEGTPNVLLEAMSQGRPVISTDTGGVREIIDDGLNGLIVRPASPKELSEKIIWLIENTEAAKKMGNNAREKVRKFFNMEKMVKETENIYRGALV
ncbi:MAG: glycosyltransferase [Elusimicrobiota bacterium]